MYRLGEFLGGYRDETLIEISWARADATTRVYRIRNDEMTARYHGILI